MRPGTKLTLGEQIYRTASDGTVVYEAFRQATGAVFPTYAVKVVHLTETPEENSSILEEVSIFSKLHNQYVLRYYGSWIGPACPGKGGEIAIPLEPEGPRPRPSQGAEAANPAHRLRSAVSAVGGTEEGACMYILMEKARHDLWTSLASFGTIIDEPLLWRWTLQLARSVEYIHSQGVIHRDINPWNVGINMEGRVCLMDFGMAIEAGEGEVVSGYSHPRGTYISPSSKESLYSAPELGAEYDARIDVYSFGVTMYVMWRSGTWRAASSEAEMDRLIEDVERVRREGAPPTGWARQHPRLRDLVRRCLSPDPAARPSSAEVLQDLKWTDVLRSDTRYLRYGQLMKAPAGLPGVGMAPEDSSMRAMKALWERPYRPASDRSVLVEQNRDEQRLRRPLTQESQASPRFNGGGGGSHMGSTWSFAAPPSSLPSPSPSPGRHLSGSPTKPPSSSNYSPSPPRAGAPPFSPGRAAAAHQYMGASHGPSPPRSPGGHTTSRSPDTTARGFLSSRSRSTTHVYASTTLKKFRRTGDHGIGLGGAAVQIHWLPTTKQESFHVQTLGWTDLSKTAPLPSGGPHALDQASCLGWTGRAEGNWDGDSALPPIGKYPVRGFPSEEPAGAPRARGGWSPGRGGLGDRGCLQGPMWGFYYDQPVPRKGADLFEEVTKTAAVSS